MYDKAIADFGKVIELDKHNAEAYNIRATLYAAMGKNDKAWADVKAAEALGKKVDKAFLEQLRRSSANK